MIPQDALIGPQAAKVLQSSVQTDVSKMFFMHGGVMDVFGIKDVQVTRCGYTGEDGFEVRITLCCHFLRCFLACEQWLFTGKESCWLPVFTCFKVSH